MGKKFEFVCEKSSSLSAFICISVPGLSHAKADRLIKSGEVRVNGARVKMNAALKAGDRVSVFLPDAMGKVSLSVVYEDQNITVFDKPKHLPYDKIPQVYGKELFPVHRLDTNTTGLIVFANTSAVQAALDAAFRGRNIVKIYEAVVSPPPLKDSDVLTAYTAMQDNMVAAVSAVRLDGYKTMVTEYKVLRRFERAALLSVTLRTGRTHQIRAHMNHIGCPVVGDAKYGGAKLPGAPDTQMLAAVFLRLDGLDEGGGLEYLNGMEFTADSKFDLDFLGKAK